jgi:hypothetical protein
MARRLEASISRIAAFEECRNALLAYRKEPTDAWETSSSCHAVVLSRECDINDTNMMELSRLIYQPELRDEHT